MATPQKFEYETLVIGLIYADEELLETVKTELEALYGEIDSESEKYSFSDFSGYYDGEAGGTVCRQFVSFKAPVDPSRLAEIKLMTNDLELTHEGATGRRVNIDPGLIGHGKYVMATTKNASWRIPLEKGIYAELTLSYARKRWNDFYWTYCDVKSERVKAYLAGVRKIYLAQRKEFEKA